MNKAVDHLGKVRVEQLEALIFINHPPISIQVILMEDISGESIRALCVVTTKKFRGPAPRL